MGGEMKEYYICEKCGAILSKNKIDELNYRSEIYTCPVCSTKNYKR